MNVVFIGHIQQLFGSVENTGGVDRIAGIRLRFIGRSRTRRLIVVIIDGIDSGGGRRCRCSADAIHFRAGDVEMTEIGHQ